MWKRCEDSYSCSIDAEVIVFNASNLEYFRLTGSGVQIWNVLSAPSSKEEIVKALCEEYQVEQADCSVELETFLNQLSEVGLITCDE